MTEQNAHMITLMRNLRERVGGEDKEHIDELLQSFEETGRKDSNSIRGTTPEDPSSQSNASCASNSHGEASPSRPPRLQGAQHHEVTPHALPNAVMTPKDTAMFEMRWYLQTQSGEEAQNILAHIDSSGSLSLQPAQKPLQGRQKYGSRYESTLDRSMNLHSLTKVPVRRDIDFQGTETNAQVTGTGNTERFHVTIGSVKGALEMFLNATGLLFHVLSKEQADTIQSDLLDESEYTDDTPFTTILNHCKNLQQKARLAELSGMAAVGLCYLGSFRKSAPPRGLSDYFYSITKQNLDNSIEADPLRAMKVCALLAMYNIIVKGSVAIAYVELGLSIAQTHGLNDPGPLGTQRTTYIDHKRTWRSLLNFSGWLSGSLGYASGRVSPKLCLLEDIHDAEDSDIVQRELVKVTIIKSSIIRAIPRNGTMDEDIIDEFRKELNAITKGLPEWMGLGTLIDSQKATPLRRIIMYFHLFFLSAMQLLHRRAMSKLAENKLPKSETAITAVREGLMAAKLAARILSLMRQEDSIIQLCWLCIYSSYISGIIVLQAAVQKMLNNKPDSTWIADLTLVHVCTDALKYCAEVDSVAAQLRDTLSAYLEELRRVKHFELNTNLGENNTEDKTIDYLFIVAGGSTILERAARDLQRLIQYPFETQLELLPGGGPKAPPLEKTLVSWMEAAVGVPQEWNWELQNCTDRNTAGEEAVDRPPGRVMDQLVPGRFVAMGEGVPWSTWTTSNFF
ncbi:hypothetical protein K504DRAFT_288900 [Pleomassaria siparia CBS 279.74]|uniref:Transcription factor domain-containing protein n=1 Tax=Pleomassaria siparia CBS 279.74 TaxID=1314801 RepID=A0A6G1K7B6_9PLEO|nr:hypothetical protein K504DRAFT_288900 [Pleomassaria siparia CBS 279.74]